MTRDEIIRDLEERAYGAGAGQYMSLRCDVAREIVDLLEEQEPRVLTVEELHPDLWIWMEYPGEEEGYDKYIGYAYLEGRKIEEWCFLTAGAKERFACPLKSYGQVWRVWTSRPTPEQMQDTPWEGAENADMR